MCRLDILMGLKRLLASSKIIKDDRQKSVMPATAGNQGFNPRKKSQNLDSSVRRNDRRKNAFQFLSLISLARHFCSF